MNNVNDRDSGGPSALEYLVNQYPSNRRVTEQASRSDPIARSAIAEANRNVEDLGVGVDKANKKILAGVVLGGAGILLGTASLLGYGMDGGNYSTLSNQVANNTAAIQDLNQGHLLVRTYFDNQCGSELRGFDVRRDSSRRDRNNYIIPGSSDRLDDVLDCLENVYENTPIRVRYGSGVESIGSWPNRFDGDDILEDLGKRYDVEVVNAGTPRPAAPRSHAPARTHTHTHTRQCGTDTINVKRSGFLGAGRIDRTHYLNDCASNYTQIVANSTCGVCSNGYLVNGTFTPNPAEYITAMNGNGGQSQNFNVRCHYPAQVSSGGNGGGTRGNPQDPPVTQDRGISADMSENNSRGTATKMD